MEMAETILSLHWALAPWRQSGARIALVPTMGNLHAGHLRLVEKAECLADCVVVSIFVNPLQFGAGEDYRSYPRTLDQDSEKLSVRGVNLLFAPSVHEIYSNGEQPMTRVEVPGLFNILCGAFRPGHFAGVATVVIKLFNLIQPHLAVFGTKDYQQLVMIKRLVADLSIPVEIVAVETVREPDGLAMSSRNSYLTPDERCRAPVLRQALRSAANRLRKGQADHQTVEAEGLATLHAAGFKPEYFSIRRAVDLALPRQDDQKLVILAAAWLGKTRLIDNVFVTLSADPA